MLTVAAITPEIARLFDIPVDGGAVISHRVAETWSAKTLRIGTAGTRIVAVAPRELDGLYADRPVDVWVPFDDSSLSSGERIARSCWPVAQLRPGTTAAEAEAALRSAPGDSTELLVLPFTGATPELTQGFSRVNSLLYVAAAFVFFAACANVACFLLGRAAARSHETSIRIAVGASRGRLARDILADSIVISVAGGALGSLLALWTSKTLPSFLFAEDAESLVLAPDASAILIQCAAAVGIIIACGFLPFFDIPHDRPARVLRRESAGPSTAATKLRSTLVVAQMACCCVLVVATAGLYQSLRSALESAIPRRLGEPVLATVRPSGASPFEYFAGVENAARSVAGVSPITWAARLPGSRPAWRSFRIDTGRSPVRDIRLDAEPFTAASIELFRSPPKAGRLFGFRDRSCRVAVINDAAASMLFGAGTVGRVLRDATGAPVEIIGVLIGGRRPALYFDYTATRARPPAAVPLARFQAPADPDLEEAELDSNVVSPSYFAAMGFTLAEGRIFSAPSGLQPCRVAVVNQEASDLYFGGNAVGAAVIDERGVRTEITGVVRSVSLSAFLSRQPPEIYFPIAQDWIPRLGTSLIMGVSAASGSLVDELRRRIEAVPGREPDPPVVKTLSTHLSQTALAPLRIVTLMFSASAVTALVLGVIGLYGGLSDTARRRRRELAVRVALGARRRHVISHVLLEGIRLAAVASIAGMLASLLVTRILSQLARDSTAPPLWTWVAGPVALAGAVGIAGILPARRASIVDPLSALRDE